MFTSRLAATAANRSTVLMRRAFQGIPIARRTTGVGHGSAGPKTMGPHNPKHPSLMQQRKSNNAFPGSLPNSIFFDVSAISKTSGVRLTQAELALLKQKLDVDGNGVVLMEEFRAMGKQYLDAQWERECCLLAVEQPTTYLDKVGAKLLQFLDWGGKTLFAVVGTQVAGEAGMNLVGCALVGCISCLGGGTLNNLLYGASPLAMKTGVNWVQNPQVLYFAMAASILTFFTWPVYCRQQARNELRDEFGRENLEPNGSVGQAAFCAACRRDLAFKTRIATALGDKLGDDVTAETIDPADLFALVDSDHSGYIEIAEMQSLVGNRFNGSAIMYALDTISFAALAVTGVHMAITRGIHPVVAATSGVTICFGGILRDVLCGRHLALGGQSYAIATGAGSTVYILLRELSLRGLPINLVARILLSASTTIGVRALEFWNGEPMCRPMHYHSGQQDQFEERLVDEIPTQPWGILLQQQNPPSQSLPADYYSSGK